MRWQQTVSRIQRHRNYQSVEALNYAGDRHFATVRYKRESGQTRVTGGVRPQSLAKHPSHPYLDWFSWISLTDDRLGPTAWPT